MHKCKHPEQATEAHEEEEAHGADQDPRHHVRRDHQRAPRALGPSQLLRPRRRTIREATNTTARRAAKVGGVIATRCMGTIAGRRRGKRAQGKHVCYHKYGYIRALMLSHIKTDYHMPARTHAHMHAYAQTHNPPYQYPDTHLCNPPPLHPSVYVCKYMRVQDASAELYDNTVAAIRRPPS